MEHQRKRPSSDQPDIYSAAESSNAPKKRKIRKGTQSCWECKRRKIRCTFAAPTDTICDGCRSRQTRCISQQFCDEVAASRKADRLSRVESLVEQLVKQGGHERSEMLSSGQPGYGNTRSAYGSTPNGTASGLHSAIDVDSHASGFGLRRALIAAWPSHHDLQIILSVPVGVSVLLHGVVCKSSSDYFSGALPSPQQVLQQPSQDAHPVLVARRLLLLAAYLQGIPPRFAGQLDGLSTDYQTIMSRVFNSATRLVTSDDELVNSIEGIECIMIESMYLNNAGNLRRAWLANRRAMVLAQMMGLHGSTKSSRMFLEGEARQRIDPDYMWFRIVCSDRYLSLMLGLPQGSPEDTFASSEVLATCLPVERMERLESIVGGLILQRNSTERTDLVAKRKIDRLLQEAAESMPAHWWVENLTAIAGNDGKAFEESVRLMMQFTHHHLLVQLHLPYMLLPSSINPSYDYSKLTAANASRAIITQYVSFHDFVSAPAYCRGVDYIAFIASTTLCIAHIEARRQYDDNVTFFQSLAHQRLMDRGLLERLLGITERTAAENSDVVAGKISSILRPLLDVENNSFKGGAYHICATETVEQESQCVGQTSEASHELRIQIPHFGTIMIEHRPPNHTLSQTRDATLLVYEPDPSPDVDSGQEEPWLDSIPGLELDVDDWALQGVDIALFSTLTQQELG